MDHHTSSGPSVQVTHEFFHALYGDDAPGWLNCWLLPSKHTQWFRARNFEAAAAYAVKQAGSADVYFGVALRRERLSKGRGEIQDVLALPGLYIEIDLKHASAHKAHNLPETIDQARQLLTKAIPLPLTMLINSGHGVHAWWLWRELWILETEAERQAAAKLLLRLQRTIQATAQVHDWHVDGTADLARVLRPPGTMNRKILEHVVPVTILEASPDTRYNPSDFEPYLIDVHVNGQPGSAESIPEDVSLIYVATLKLPRWLKYVIRTGDHPDDPQRYSDRSTPEWAALQGLIKAGYDDRTIAGVMLNPQHVVSEKPRERGRRWLEQEIGRARAKAQSSSSKASGRNGEASHDETAQQAAADQGPEQAEDEGPGGNGDEIHGAPASEHPSAKAFFRKKTFIPKRLGDYLLYRFQIKYAAGLLWVYRHGVYVADGERILAAAAQYLLVEERRQNRLEETLRYIEVATYTDMPPPDLCVINVLNGRLEWATDTLHEHTPDVFTVIQLPAAYDPHAICPTFDKYLETTFDDDVIPLVEEVMGHALIPDTRYEKAIMLTGEGENGKSVFIDTLTALLGSQHVSNVALQDLEENRFRVPELFGKLGNFFADLDPRALKSSSLFKALVTGDEIEAERKYQQPFKFRNVARLVFSANKIPDSSDRTHAFYRRWLVIPFTRTFTGDTRDPDLRTKLQGELPGILNRALCGLRRLQDQRAFTMPQAVKDALNQYERQNDSLAAFLDEAVDIGPKFSVTKQRFYRQYCRWCDLYRLRPISQKELPGRLYKLVPELDEARFDSRGKRGGKGPWRWIGLQPIDDGPDEDEG